jgi:hypothetical protein
MPSPTLPDLLARFDAAAGATAMAWLLDVAIAVRADRGSVHAALDEAARRVPATALDGDGWRADDVARLLILRACGPDLVDLLPAIYRTGGPSIRRTLFLALPLLDLDLHGQRREATLAVA